MKKYKTPLGIILAIVGAVAITVLAFSCTSRKDRVNVEIKQLRELMIITWENGYLTSTSIYAKGNFSSIQYEKDKQHYTYKLDTSLILKLKNTK